MKSSASEDCLPSRKQRVKQYTVNQRGSETSSIQWCNQPFLDVSSLSIVGFGEDLPLRLGCSSPPFWDLFLWRDHGTLQGTEKQYGQPSLMATINLSRLDEGYVFIHYMSQPSLSFTLKMFL